MADAVEGLEDAHRLLQDLTSREFQSGREAHLGKNCGDFGSTSGRGFTPVIAAPSLQGHTFLFFTADDNNLLILHLYRGYRVFAL